MIYIHIVVLESYMLHTKFRWNRSTGSREEDFWKGYNIWVWWPSCSCDLDYLYIHWFPLPIDDSYKIWLWFAKRFQRRSLKMWTDARTDARTPARVPFYELPMSLRLRWAKKLCTVAFFGTPCKMRYSGVTFLANLSRRLTGELLVYPCSGVRPSSVRPSVVRPSFTISKIFSSKTAWPIKAKLHVEHP